jgi:glycosyltransferase involved in cell wall biosynthesis
MSASVSVLVPVYNNAASLEELHRRLVATLESMQRRFEIVFVNDGSADESLAILRRLAERDPRCVVLSLSRNFGQHPAINAGLTRVSGDITILMDADLQDRPEELPHLLEPFSDPDVDIVYTQFELVAGEKARLTSRLFHRAFAKLSDVHIPPSLGTYRAFTARVRDALLDYPERNAVYGPLMAQMGYEHVYITVGRDAPVGRKTSYNFRRRLSLAVSSVISYGSFLHRFVTWIGLSLTTLSGGYLIVVLIQYVTGFRALVNGQLLLLVITVLMSGVLLMTVGVLTAYTYRIFQEVLARPRFHVAREFGHGLPRDGA